MGEPSYIRVLLVISVFTVLTLSLMTNFLRTFRSLYELGFSALITASLIIQFTYGAYISGGLTISYVVQFITYFTILSNVLVAVVLMTEGLANFRHTQLPKRFDRIRGTAVFCIFTTGIIYSLFLKGPGGAGAVQDSIPWINSVFHYIMPTVMMLDWIVFPTKTPEKWLSIIKWILITVVYFIYVEILGFFSHAYPYFFLNPTLFHGYWAVFRGSLTFIPFFIVFGAIVVGVNRLRLSSSALHFLK